MHNKHSERQHWKGLVSIKISDTQSFFKTNPPILPTIHFYENNLKSHHLFVKSSKSQPHPHPLKKGFQL